MKKTLMGTTALVAAAVAVSGARADEMMAEPISISVGGNSHWGVAIVDNDATPNNDDIAIANDVELNFTGSTVLDSGLEVGVRIEIEGEQSGDQGDRTYAFVSGSFGEIRIGNDSDMSEKMGTSAPYATFFYGLNTPYWSYDLSGGSISTFAGANFQDGATLLYFSPVINGFQFGVSYTPESIADAGGEARSGVAPQGEDNDVHSVGARYDGAFGDAGVTVAVGYASLNGADGTTTDDMAAGVVVSMSGVSVGGSYRVMDNESPDDTAMYDVGIMYGDGPWNISLNWGHGEDADTGRDSDFTRLLGNYNIGPGINLAGGVGSDSYAGGNDTTFAGIALAISF
jgi:outer membrane protein OmpU